MELIATSRRHLEDRNIQAAVETALDACQHPGPELEVPDLRNARINLLVEVLDCVTALQTVIGKEELEILQALLERRIFNFLQDGNNEAEVDRFSGLFPWGSGVFDGGRDRPRPISLDKYIHCMLRREDVWSNSEQTEQDAWSTWMFAQSAAVKVEVEKRMCTKRNRRRFPVGTAVRVCGLKNAPDLNGCRGVVVGFQQQRFQIKFDQIDKEPKAVLPANLEPNTFSNVEQTFSNTYNLEQLKQAHTLLERSVEQQDGTCAFCSKSLLTAGRMSLQPCGHTFHEVCIFHHRRQSDSNKCPNCQAESPDLEPVQKLLSDSMDLWCRGRRDESFLLLSRAHDIDPDNEEISIFLAQCFMHGWGVPQDMEHAKTLHPDDLSAEFLADRAMAHFNKGAGNENSFLLLRQANELDPSDRFAAELLGEHYLMGWGTPEHLEQAALVLHAARKQGSNRSLVLLGRAHLKKGELTEAHALFEQAIESGGEGFAEAMFSLAVMCEEQKRFGEAMSLYKKLHVRAQRLVASWGEHSPLPWPERNSAFRLALLYMAGHRDDDGVSDAARVEDLLEAGCKHGDPQAAECLKELRMAMPFKFRPDVLQQNTNMGFSAPAVDSTETIAEQDLFVWLLKYSRGAGALRDILLDCPKVNDIIEKLKAHGYDWEVPEGGKILVEPHQYPQVLEILRLGTQSAADSATKGTPRRLGSDHLIVAPVFTELVQHLAKSLPRKHKVSLRDATQLPLGFAGSSGDMPFLVEIANTFIKIHLPRSMRSESSAEASHIASTTDADRRKKKHKIRKNFKPPLVH